MMAAETQTFFFPPPAVPVGYDHIPHDGIDFSHLNDFNMRQGLDDPDHHAALMPAIAHSSRPAVAQQLPQATPLSTLRPADYPRSGSAVASEVGASLIAFALAPPTDSADGRGPHGQSCPPGAHEREAFDGSSASPEEKVLTPSSSHPGYASFNEGSFGNVEEDTYSIRSGFSPSSSNVTDTHEVGWRRNPSAVAGSLSSDRMSNHSLRLIPDTGASRVSPYMSVPVSTPKAAFDVRSGSYHLGSTAWMEGHTEDASYDLLNNTSDNYDAGPAIGYATPDQFNNYLYSEAGPFASVPAPNYESPLAFRTLDNYAAEQDFYRGPFLIQQPPVQHAHFQYDDGQVLMQQGPLETSHLIPQPPFHTDVPMAGAIHHERPVSLVQHQQHMTNLRTAPPSAAQSRATARPAHRPPHRTHTTALNVGTRPADPGSRATHLVMGNVSKSRRVAPAQRAQGIRPAKDESTSPRSSHSGLAMHAKRPYHPLVKAEPGAVVKPTGQDLSQKMLKGGRKQGLSPDAKQRTSAMRHSGACWKCVLQRDQCDGNSPCKRCMSRSQRGQAHYFECSRLKLPELVREFLPPTMTLMHERQTIEDTVHREVSHWAEDNPINVYLYTGYGPPLQWVVHEFYPRTKELLDQLQYFQNVETGVSQSRKKYSPPLGLLKLDDSDDAHVKSYLDMLMTEECLSDLGWVCFPEELQRDSSAFQCNLLDFMCKLYLETDDGELRQHLHLILRMMIITYIMGHTLTLSDEAAYDVVSKIRFSEQPNTLSRHTSPRLANRQLKFFFAWLRLNIYDEILKWQQQTFHNSKKDGTWLTSFCAVLGFAMVLEEVQRTLHIQADAKIVKREMPAEQAIAEACNACDRIDDRFKLLVGLFQCKYRDRKWTVGSFGPSTPGFPKLAEHRFLTQLRDLVEEKADYLAERQNVECRPENQCRYTSRLVARFLLPFRNLPG